MTQDRDDAWFAMLSANGYHYARKLPSGEWAALQRFAFTVGLCVGLDETGYRCRWCFHDMAEAHLALDNWDGHGDPPGAWIKQKGRLRDRRPVDRNRGEPLPDHPDDVAFALEEARAKFPPMWTVYQSPRDYPGLVVVRVWYGTTAEPQPWLCLDIDDARARIVMAGGSVALPRAPTDDPVIVETWL